MKEETYIVKIQKPLMTNDPNRPWRVYDQDRHFDVTIPEAQIPKRIRKHMQYISKAYYKAELTYQGWVFQKPTKERAW